MKLTRTGSKNAPLILIATSRNRISTITSFVDQMNIAVLFSKLIMKRLGVVSYQNIAARVEFGEENT